MPTSASPLVAREADATDTFVMPGIVDDHVHYRRGGRTGRIHRGGHPEVRMADVSDYRSPAIFGALAGGSRR